MKVCSCYVVIEELVTGLLEIGLLEIMAMANGTSVIQEVALAIADYSKISENSCPNKKQMSFPKHKIGIKFCRLETWPIKTRNHNLFSADIAQLCICRKLVD